MTEHDDNLSRRYRELAREEPPASLDATILAAAKQAVRPGTRSRWMGPVAVATVLVLGLGIALRMQVEQPGIESTAPEPSSSAEYPVAPPAEEPPAAPERDAAPMQSTAVPPPRAQPKLGIAAEGLAPQRAKRAESATAADASAPAKDAREVELERIARLRSEGRHADADKALEAFRRANPDYRIAEAMWERVRPR